VCFALQVPDGLELAVNTMRSEERALITVSDPALAAAPEGECGDASIRRRLLAVKSAGADAMHAVRLRGLLPAPGTDIRIR
jgi:hypothetical protein